MVGEALYFSLRFVYRTQKEFGFKNTLLGHSSISVDDYNSRRAEALDEPILQFEQKARRDLGVEAYSKAENGQLIRFFLNNERSESGKIEKFCRYYEAKKYSLSATFDTIELSRAGKSCKFKNEYFLTLLNPTQPEDQQKCQLAKVGAEALYITIPELGQKYTPAASRFIAEPSYYLYSSGVGHNVAEDFAKGLTRPEFAIGLGDFYRDPKYDQLQLGIPDGLVFYFHFCAVKGGSLSDPGNVFSVWPELPFRFFPTQIIDYPEDTRPLLDLERVGPLPYSYSLKSPEDFNELKAYCEAYLYPEVHYEFGLTITNSLAGWSLEFPSTLVRMQSYFDIPRFEELKIKKRKESVWIIKTKDGYTTV